MERTTTTTATDKNDHILLLQQQSEAHNGGTHDGLVSEIVLSQHASLALLMEFLAHWYFTFLPFWVFVRNRRKIVLNRDLPYFAIECHCQDFCNGI